jgi:predicted nucleic acid-binding protein
VTLYLDTSSLVKLYVAGPGSEAVRKLVDDATVVATSSIAYTETRAALARRHRERGLRPAAFASGKKTFRDRLAQALHRRCNVGPVSRGRRVCGTQQASGLRQRASGCIR